ncbi:TetR/AcrR family transcriptional regulator [Corynebacterium sanguinis]|uniref:TetR/AcrR family transcriptional regulator n=1 Tax=Corynebacterium sanguinis TaxID=2594913 RepID=UPI0011A3F16A|nr:TetR/AcrR family transcriptional regulator [Corynebacterium sanguinis]TVS24711.1 TetR/AcrR family transcriptional regulator [Corynebacterium sanguinis]
MRADVQRKRQLIVDAATRAFRTVPDASITLEGIAKDAGVGIATLYRHFPTWRDLHVACAVDLLDSLEAGFTQSLPTFDQDPERHWKELIWRMVEQGTGMLVAALAEQRSGEISPLLLSKLERAIEKFELLLRKASDHGLVDPDLTAREIAAELIVVTRPQSRTINELFPDVRNRLVEHLLEAWKRPRTARL